MALVAAGVLEDYSNQSIIYQIFFSIAQIYGFFLMYLIVSRVSFWYR